MFPSKGQGQVNKERTQKKEPREKEKREARGKS